MSARPQQGLVNHVDDRMPALSKPLEPSMTSISASSSSAYLTPLQKLQQALQAELTSGKVNAADSDALSSALAEIDKSLSSDKAGQSHIVPSKPADLKTAIDDLIDAQVASGKLTSDQATELQGVFKAAFAGGPGGAGGPPPGPPPADNASTDTTDATGTTTDPETALQKLLKTLQESLAATSAGSYGATGNSASATNKSSFSALLINYTS
jgi:hypothetical protein